MSAEASRKRPGEPLLFLAGGVLVYIVLIFVSRVSVHQHGWLAFESIAGSFALARAAQAALAIAGSVLGLSMLRRGVILLIAGLPSLIVPLTLVPPGGYHGWAFFWAYSLVFGGFYVVLFALAYVWSGWPQRPAAVKRLQAEIAAAHKQAAQEQTATGGAPPTGHYELTLAAGPGRFVFAAFSGLLGIIGLGLLVISVLIVATSTPDNPAPVGQYVVLGAVGVLLSLAGGTGAVGMIRMRGWLDGTTLNVIRPTGHKSTDLAMVHRASVTGANGQSGPILRLSGGGGHLRILPLHQWGTRRLLPTGDLIRIAGALAASPLHPQFAGAIESLRDAARFSTGHQRVTARH